MANWQNRIVRYGEESPDQLLANPDNWRIHPGDQQAVMRDLLDRVGWVTDIIVNERTGHVVDGHLRVSLAISQGVLTVPVVYVDLDVEEEKLVLATLDPLAAMAARDDAKLMDLLNELTEDGYLGSMLDRLADDVTPYAPIASLPSQEHALPENVNLVCPECGEEFAMLRKELLARQTSPDAV